jgi:hypothetical protein
MVSTRDLIVSDLKNIPKYIKTDNWNVSEDKYESGNVSISFDNIKLDTNSEGNKRYTFDHNNRDDDSDSESESESKKSFTMDDVLLISMIIFSFYRFQHNIGRKTASTMLSTAYTNIASKKEKERFGEKLENHWSEEMEALFVDDSNPFNVKTTTTSDNYFMFFNFYPKPRQDQNWDRYAVTKSGEKAAKFYLHEYANNGVIQLAKHLCDADDDYLDLAHVLMVYIKGNEWNDMVDTIAKHLKDGPKTVLKKLNY